MARPGEHVADRVDDYLHGLLAAADERHVERHCLSCPECHAALERARQRLRLLQSVPVHEPSHELVKKTMNKISEHESQRGRLSRRLVLGYCVGIAAAVVVLVGASFYYEGLRPTTPNLRVYGQRQLQAGTPASLRVRLTNQASGQPLANVPGTIEINGPDGPVQLASFTTDQHGSISSDFQVPDWAEGNYDLRITAKTPDKDEVYTEKVTLKRAEKVMLSSDKPIYQPGQTIHVRALSLRQGTLRPCAGQTATFSIRDPKNNVIFKRQMPTSTFGIASIDCPLASEVIEGPYTIDCTAGTTASSLTVKVFKYVLPKFKVEGKLDREYYKPGDRVQGTVEARYFFGKPVPGKVEAHATIAGQGGETVFKATLDLDADGKAELDFGLPEKLFGREQDGGDARLVVQLQATDTAGQKQSAEVTRMVTTQPLKLEVVPENGSLVAGTPNKVYLMTSYADGRAAPTRLTVDDGEEVRTNALGVAVVEVTPADGDVSLGVVARDDKGLWLRRVVRLSPSRVSQDFIVRTDRAVYDGGRTMNLTVLGVGQQPVFLDVLKEGQTLRTAVVDVKDGKGELALDLAPEWAGTLQLFAYRMDNATALPVRKVRTIYVRPANQLEVQVTQDREEYRPGDKAQLKFRLVDKNNKGVPGALTLAGVDEAVFSVNENGPGMEKTFYLLEKELLKPVYAVYPWTPDLDRDIPMEDDRVLLEQALFSRTAGTAQGPRPVQNQRWGGMPTPAPLPAPMTESRPAMTVTVPEPHTLAGDTYQVKAAQVQQQKKKAEKWLAVSWVGLFASLAMGVYVILWVYCSRTVMLILHVVGGAFALGGVMFASLFFLVAAKEERRMMAVDMAGGEATVEMATSAAPSPTWRESGRQPIETPMTAPPLADVETRIQGPRLREWFPETLLWQAELRTEPDGSLVVPVQLADSITTWRITASAVTADGNLGAARHDLRVFQPFFVDLNLPVSLTRNDEVAIPVVVYNHMKEPQPVTLTLEKADWFEMLEEKQEKKLDLAVGEVRAVSYRIKVTKVGDHKLRVKAQAPQAGDEMVRKIEVVPDGHKVEVVHNGSLGASAQMKLTLPEDAIDGSARLVVKVYPSTFSQLVEGLDNIFHMPYGCFEQTSSTTYPNVLALDYLKTAGKRNPEVEARARQYIHLGYQRLLGFEVQGGGFDWYGKGPANVSLSAYGLMEFQDMARVHDVDPNLIRRTRAWILKQRDDDGSWSKAGQGRRFYGAGGTNYAVTAYIAWAVFGDPDARSQGEPTRRYLLSVKPDEINDPYVLAVTANALLALDPDGQDAAPYLDRLESLKKTTEDGRQVWWEQGGQGAETMFHGRGRSGSVETTALAVLARIKAKRNPNLTRGALSWLVAQKDPRGTWQSTQATVLALKALLQGTAGLGGDRERTFEVMFPGMEKPQAHTVKPDQAEVLQEYNLTHLLKTGTHTLQVRELSDTAATYQVTFRYHVPTAPGAVGQEPLAIDLAYDRGELKVNDLLKVKATVRNNRNEAAPMVMLDLPIPAGFRMLPDDLQKLVEAGVIDRYQVNPRSAIVYLRKLERDRPLELSYRLQPTMPVKLTVPGGRVYEYYDPEKEARSRTTSLTVTR